MMLALCFAWFTLLAGAFLIWLYTPKGKNGYRNFKRFLGILVIWKDLHW